MKRIFLALIAAALIPLSGGLGVPEALAARNRASIAAKPERAPRVAPAGRRIAVAVPDGALKAHGLAASALPSAARALAAPAGESGKPAAEPPAPAAQAYAVEKLNESSPIRVIRHGQNAAGALGTLYDRARTEEELRGKALVLVGGIRAGRTHNIAEPLRVAQKLGLRLIVVDDADNPPPVELIPREDFIAAPIGDHRPESIAQAARLAAEEVLKRGTPVAGVYCILGPFAEVGAAIRDELRKRHPDLPGDTYDAVHAANEKHLARQRMNAGAPDLAVAYEEVRSAQEAREAFLRITGGKPGLRVVIKPIKSAGKIETHIDIAGPEEAAATFQKVEEGLRTIKDKIGDLASFHSVDIYSGIIMELQLEINGRPAPEVDVETVRAVNGGFSVVVGNPRPRPGSKQQEKGFSMPSPLPDGYHDGFIRTVFRGLDALGLTLGNYHPELKWAQVGPRFIETNPRMGGSNMFAMFREMFGVSLIEQGIRAVLGLPVSLPASLSQKYPSLVSRESLPQYGGKVVSIRGAEEMMSRPGVVASLSKISKKPGDRILHPDEGYADDIHGVLVASGESFRQARENAISALREVEITVETKDGEVVTQSAAYSHGEIEEFEEGPAASQP